MDREKLAMVDVRPHHPYRTPSGVPRHGHIRIQVTITNELFDQIRAEAKTRDWTISRMVRHLCEASIEGIE